MKIGELKRHCGDCGIIEFCGNYNYYICDSVRFENLDDEEYFKCALDASGYDVECPDRHNGLCQ